MTEQTRQRNWLSDCRESRTSNKSPASHGRSAALTDIICHDIILFVRTLSVFSVLIFHQACYVCLCAIGTGMCTFCHLHRWLLSPTTHTSYTLICPISTCLLAGGSFPIRYWRNYNQPLKKNFMRHCTGFNLGRALNPFCSATPVHYSLWSGKV